MMVVMGLVGDGFCGMHLQARPADLDGRRSDLDGRERRNRATRGEPMVNDACGDGEAVPGHGREVLVET